MRKFVSEIINGDVEKLTEVVEAQCRGEMFLRSLRSRSVEANCRICFTVVAAVQSKTFYNCFLACKSNF